MEALINSCLASGWILDRVTYTPNQMLSLLPPKGDPRRNWCAMWEKVKFEGKIVLVPHWAQSGSFKYKSWTKRTNTENES